MDARERLFSTLGGKILPHSPMSLFIEDKWLI